MPKQWAQTQTNLGFALLSLGVREGGTARLEQAVEAYRAALTERTRERVPLDWATTEYGLGIALTRLGEREGGTARLEEAVEPPDDAWQQAPAWGAIARRRVLDLSPRGNHQRRAVAGQRPGAHVRAAHGVRALRNYRRQRAAELARALGAWGGLPVTHIFDA